MDLEKPSNQRLREFSTPLEAFEESWRNGTPTSAAVAEILPTIEQCSQSLGDGDADAPVVEMVRTRIATAAMLAARVVESTDRAFGTVRATLLGAARKSLVDGDEPRNEDSDYPAWSPRPETEAAQGLPWGRASAAR